MAALRLIALATACMTLATLAPAQEQAPKDSAAAPPSAESAEPPAENSSQKAPTPAAPAAPQYSRRGADSCIACHDDEHVLAIFKTAHARHTDPRTPFGHGQLQCEACHGPGGAHAGRVRSGEDRPPIPMFGHDSPATVKERNDACLGCHQGNVEQHWPLNAHEREGVACSSCHQIHAAHDPVLSKTTQAETCMGCHPQQRAQSQLPFTHPIRQERMACSDCHSPHGSIADFALLGRTLNDTCFTCHADKRGPYLWEHAPVTEDCSICHEPHGSSNPGMLRQRPPLLCQECHSEAGHPSVPLSGTQLPGATPSAQALGQGCANCHSRVHGSNHPSGAALMR
jgi:DmsE family decaheme c-type cytochrome